MRSICLAALLVGLAATSASSADPELAPPPREVRADGSRDPVPEATVPKAQNPLETVERIIENSKAVGDKLSKTDLGSETQKTQDTILKDIQSLIDREENPPPPMPDQNKDDNKDKNEDNSKDKGDSKDMGEQKDKNKDGKPDDSKGKSDGMPMNGMGEPPSPKKDGPSGGGMGQPMDGDGNPHPKGRKPRQPSEDRPKEKDSPSPKGGMGQKDDKATSKSAGNASKDPKQGGGRVPNANAKGELPPTAPSLPPEEAVAKDVWGYLPDKLRTQAMQYYKQDFMPRYSKLLEQYYSSLADKNYKK